MRKGTRETPVEVLKKTYDCYQKNNQSVRATSQIMGLDRATVARRVDRYKNHIEGQKKDIEFPDFPPDSLPVADVIERLAEASALRKSSYKAHTWFPVKITDDKPIGIFWFGDPHVDDDGCDWTLLKHHIELCKKPGVYGVNIGDTTNNWAGRLVRKYADQETSAKTAGKLAEWFMLDSGIRWLLFLLGNHDTWGDGAAILNQMAKRYGTHKLVLHDWEARFRINFSNGVGINVWAAHDFPGFSMWHNLHGPIKAAKMGADVDLLVCGHKHCWAIHQEELPEKGLSPTLIRVRGYKFNDEYARKLGITEQEHGASILTIINPKASRIPDRVIPFTDLESGVDYLQWLRKQA